MFLIAISCPFFCPSTHTFFRSPYIFMFLHFFQLLDYCPLCHSPPFASRKNFRIYSPRICVNISVGDIWIWMINVPAGLPTTTSTSPFVPLPPLSHFFLEPKSIPLNADFFCCIAHFPSSKIFLWQFNKFSTKSPSLPLNPFKWPKSLE